MRGGSMPDDRMLLAGNLLGEILATFRVWLNDTTGRMHLEHRPCRAALPDSFERNLDEIVGEALAHHVKCRAER